MMNKRTNSEDDGYYGCEPFLLMAKPLGIDYTVNINDAFVHPKQFEYVVHTMDNATENDYFTLNLTTPGGSLQSVLPLLGAMENTLAHVHVHACSDVASAGTLLLLKAHSVSMNNHIEVMFHQVRFGAGGPGWNVERQVEHTLKSSKRLLRETYKFFFTEDEIERMLTGTDFYMDKEEFVERYTKRSELISAEVEKLVEAEEAAQKPQRKPRNKKAVDVPQEA